jgi:hypothetical protein
MPLASARRRDLAGVKSISEESIVSAGAGVVSCDLIGAAALLNMQSNTYYTLNEVGSRIWGLIQKPTSVSSICSEVSARYEVDTTRCHDDVVALLRALNDAGLIEIVEGAAHKVPGTQPVG